MVASVRYDLTKHTVSGSDGLWGSPPITTGQTFECTFTTPGTYSYFCAYHPFMKGQVIVRGS